MGGRLLDDVARLLADVEDSQHALESLFERKREALKRPRHDELLDVAREETQIVASLQRHLSRRKELLADAALAGFRGHTLTDVVRGVGGAEAEALAPRMRRVGENSERLRRESWVQWVVTQRAGRHYAGLLDLLVHHGERPVTYGSRRNDTNGAGALLDASA